MQQLHRKGAAMPLYRPGDIRESFKLRVVPKSGKAYGGVDCVLVDEVAAENDHPQASLGALLVVGNRLFRKDSFVGIAHPSWTHRRKNHAIRNGRVSDPQRRKKMRIRIGIHSQSTLNI